MSRHWRRVSKALQKLAAGLHAVKNEGMFPYEITMFSQPMKNSSDSTIGEQRWMSTCAASGITK